MIDMVTESARGRLGDYGHHLEFGVFLRPAAQSAAEVVGLSVLAEGVGYDLVTFNDHPNSPGFLDTLTLMSFVAARTGRVRLAANVLSLPLRPLAVLARALASLDILSHGRAELGICGRPAALSGRTQRPAPPRR
jgi:alkanesulfonate monooxygenase SsuD/methylene tetrahydromethanopterin reductase-like flavin-dependent oxidoreductase (luciferase family)